jgi:LemA protein
MIPTITIGLSAQEIQGAAPAGGSSLATAMIIASVAVVTLAWLILAVSALKQLANVCDESWSDVVHDLNRRHELVPRMVETARPVLSEHAELLDGMLTASREAVEQRRGGPGELGLAESAVAITLQRLLVLVEQRPTLKQDPAFQKLRKELVDIEDRIQSSRRMYNTSARDLNRRAQSFPVGLLAGSATTAKREVFEMLPIGLAGPATNGRE